MKFINSLATHYVICFIPQYLIFMSSSHFPLHCNLMPYLCSILWVRGSVSHPYKIENVIWHTVSSALCTYLWHLQCDCSMHSPEVGLCHSNWQHVNRNTVYSFVSNLKFRISSQTVGQAYLLSYGEHTGVPSVLLFYIKVDIKENNFLQLILQILKSGKILAKITYVKLYQTFVMSVLV